MEKAKYDQSIENRLLASFLTDFYMAVEKIFKNIARDIDEEIPEGEAWHKKLLRQMAIEIPEERPAVISDEMFEVLEEYLRFQHLAQNIYGFQLERERFSHLIEKLSGTHNQLEKEIKDFIKTMKKITRKTENDHP